MNPRRDKFIWAVRQVIKNYHHAFILSYPENPLSYERMGYLHIQCGELDEAIESFTTAVTLGADKSGFWRTFGKCCILHWKGSGEWDVLLKAKEAYKVRPFPLSPHDLSTASLAPHGDVRESPCPLRIRYPLGLVRSLP
jgi:hypothetical protein